MLLVGTTQLNQGDGGGLAAVPAAAVDQDRGILLGDYLCGGRFINGAHRQENGAEDVAASARMPTRRLLAPYRPPK